jgi:hypothetical protein
MWVARRHFEGIRCKEYGQISLGDTIAVDGEDSELFMMVKELFEDVLVSWLTRARELNLVSM